MAIDADREPCRSVGVSQKDDLVVGIFRQCCLRDCLKIGDAPADGEIELAGEDHGGKWLPCSLASYGLDYHIFILAEQDPSQFASAAQQVRIGRLRIFILLCGEHVHASPPKATSYGARRMHVHVETQTHPFRRWEASRR